MRQIALREISKPQADYIKELRLGFKKTTGTSDKRILTALLRSDRKLVKRGKGGAVLLTERGKILADTL